MAEEGSRRQPGMTSASLPYRGGVAVASFPRRCGIERATASHDARRRTR
jgi:hypothetical protein